MLTTEAQATGCVNTTFFRPSRAESTASLAHFGTNTDSAAVLNTLLASFLGKPSPFDASSPHSFAPQAKVAAFAVGGGGATRASIHAMHALGLSPIFIANRDNAEIEAIVRHFGEWDVRPLDSAEEARVAIKRLRDEGGRVVCGVGAIPSEEPRTEGEKRVYEVADAVFSQLDEKSTQATQEEGYLSLPEKPVFVGTPVVCVCMLCFIADAFLCRHGLQAAHDKVAGTRGGTRLGQHLRDRGRTGTLGLLH